MLPPAWYAPGCERVVDSINWDFTPCFEQTTLDALPHLILILSGGYAFPRLWRKYKRGRHENLSKQGKAAYGIKLVSPNLPPLETDHLLPTRSPGFADSKRSVYRDLLLR